jgi:hypothetical protein
MQSFELDAETDSICTAPQSSPFPRGQWPMCQTGFFDPDEAIIPTRSDNPSGFR